MTINSQTRKAGPYVGTGSTGPYSFSFKVFQASDLLVVKVNNSTSVETTLTLTTDFTASINPDQDSNPGGSITLVAPLVSGYSMIISSDVPNLQQTDLTNQGGFYPDVITDALDRATIQIQQLQEGVDRSAKLPITSTVDANVLSDNIARLASSADNIDEVADNLPNVNAVANNQTNINTVVTNLPVITSVNNNFSVINAVNSNSTNINAVNANATNINIVATNVNDVTNFSDVYYGYAIVDPTTRKNGSPLQVGDLYFNSSSDKMRVYNGIEWQDQSSAPDTVVTATFTATAGQTTYVFTGGYRQNFIYIYVNGSLLNFNDFTATDGTNIIFASPLSAGDEVIAITFFAAGSAATGNSGLMFYFAAA